MHSLTENIFLRFNHTCLARARKEVSSLNYTSVSHLVIYPVQLSSCFPNEFKLKKYFIININLNSLLNQTSQCLIQCKHHNI